MTCNSGSRDVAGDSFLHHVAGEWSLLWNSWIDALPWLVWTEHVSRPNVLLFGMPSTNRGGHVVLALVAGLLGSKAAWGRLVSISFGFRATRRLALHAVCGMGARTASLHRSLL